MLDTFDDWVSDLADPKFPDFNGQKVLGLDLETTVQEIEVANKEDDTKTDGSPFNPDNKCVSAHWAWKTFSGTTPVESRVFYHNEKPVPDERESLREALLAADILVAHNAKFDIQWLMELGFPIPPKVYCTMIGEYIFARGRPEELSLEASAERRGVSLKKGELVKGLFKSGIGFEAIPLPTVLEYAEADVVSCLELYEDQQQRLSRPADAGLKPVFDLMNDMLLFLIEIEANGCMIDMEALSEVEEEFLAEKAEIEKRLAEIVETVMGDTPINLNSGADLTKVIYSRQVTDKKLHQEIFKIGTGPSGKPLPTPRMSPNQFSGAVRATTRVVRRTVVECCGYCKGSGKQFKIKKNGEPYKSQPKCKTCEGEGVVYRETSQTAGLKLVPTGPRDASILGFKAGKDLIPLLIAQAQSKGNDTAVEFLTKVSRLNAISSYLTTFINGIRTWVRSDGILHANFNQAVAATGRLSSTKPNFQNLPKGGKFPVRRAIISRFKGGLILEADYSGLEFRVAGELSRCPQIIRDILEGKDIHKQTASIILQKAVADVVKGERQDAKKYSFAPIYGGQGALEPPHIQNYFKEYFRIYTGHKAYIERLCDGVLKDGMVRIPSGREYYFPNARRLGGGRITNHTNVCNYPVQGFATADIVPLACIRALRAFKKAGLRSCLILTVHDSIVVDVAPGELDAVKAALTWAMRDVPEEMETRWNYKTVLPLDIEMECGPNWMTMQETPVPSPEEALPMAA